LSCRAKNNTLGIKSFADSKFDVPKMKKPHLNTNDSLHLARRASVLQKAQHDVVVVLGTGVWRDGVYLFSPMIQKLARNGDAEK
jgi:hypothetical protein